MNTQEIVIKVRIVLEVETSQGNVSIESAPDKQLPVTKQPLQYSTKKVGRPKGWKPGMKYSDMRAETEKTPKEIVAGGHELPKDYAVPEFIECCNKVNCVTKKRFEKAKGYNFNDRIYCCSACYFQSIENIKL